MFGSKLVIKTPLRVSWNLEGVAALNEETLALYKRIKERFLFEFNLIVSGSLMTDDSQEFWDAIRKTLCETNLIINGAGSCSSDFINLYVFRQIQVDWSDFTGASLKLYDSLSGEKAVRFVLKEQNLSRIGELLELVREKGVTTLIFANPVIENGNGNDYLFGREVMKQAVERYQSEFVSLERNCKVQVHDLCLEELMFGSRRREGNYAGCQAGLYLAHVNARGQVYGCSSLPIPIGDLTASTWEKVWQSEPRKLLRKQIEKPAPPCAECVTFNHCRGGCRGLSWIQHGDFEHRDLLCEV